MSGRPRLVLAMREELPAGFFGPDEWRRIEAVSDIVSGKAFTDFDSGRGRDALAEADILLAAWGAPSLTAERLARAPRLRMVAYAAASVRAIAPAPFWQRDILITSAVSAMAVPVAEFTYAAVVMMGKDIFRFHKQHSACRGQGGFGTRISMDHVHLGNYRRRIGIVGASTIGRLVIDLLVHSKFEVGIYDPFLSDAEAMAMGGVKMELHPLLAWADTVSLHAPVLPSTRHMIGAAQLALMRDNAVLINTARGWLVDHGALLAEAESGRLRVLIDTPDPEPLPPDSRFYDLDNVVLTPHIAGAQGNELRRLADLAITEIERFTAGLAPLHPVREADLEKIA